MSWVRYVRMPGYEPLEVNYTAGLNAYSSQLSAPDNINIHPGYTSVSANWARVNGATQYLITISGNGMQPIYQHTNVSNINISSGLQAGSQYKFSIEPIQNGIKGPSAERDFVTLSEPSANLQISNQLQAVPSPSPSPSLSTILSNCDNCTDNDSCTGCAGMPVCLNKKCQVCDPNGRITSDSLCHGYGYVCSEVNGEPACQLCNKFGDKSNQMCRTGYGNEYHCDMPSGLCVKNSYSGGGGTLQASAPLGVSPAPSPKPKSNKEVYIALGIALLLVVVITILFFLFLHTIGKQ